MAHKPKRKGVSGKVGSHVSRNQAIRRLQISLKNFRRLCIYKGIYPVDIKGKIVYHKKDVTFLSHDPLIPFFRLENIHKKKMKIAINNQDTSAIKELNLSKPELRLDHVVKQRYPTFDDAIKSLDDALSLIFAFGDLPSSRHISIKLIDECKRLSNEFLHYVLVKRCLKKVFISIKGFYFQVNINGHDVTFIVPHSLVPIFPRNVDYKILKSFLEFYTTYLGFVNCHLFNTINLKYPPKITGGIMKHKPKQYISDQDLSCQLLGTLNYPLRENHEEITNAPEIDTFDNFKINEKQESLINIFKDYKFFISSEVPKKPFVLAIKCCGGEASWDDDSKLGLLYPENDPSITHQIMDRPEPKTRYAGRMYIQPQWIFDSINSGACLPIEKYLPNATLPPHISPFNSEKYPHLIADMNLDSDKTEGFNKDILLEKNITSKEQEKLASQSLSRNKKKLYDKLQKIRKYRVKKIRKLKERKNKISNDEIKLSVN